MPEEVMSRPDLLEALASKAREVRAAPKAYFAASRAGGFRGAELDTSRRLERELDRLLEQLDAPQGSLFGGES
jgi:hypothetical protein